jgi:transposase
MDAKATYQELKKAFRTDLKGKTASIIEAAQLNGLKVSTVQRWVTTGRVKVVVPAPRRGMASQISLRDVAIMIELNRIYRQETNTRGPLKGFKL